MISCCAMFCIFMLLTSPEFVNGCIVHPTSVVVTVGKRAILACTTHEGGFITSWHIETNTAEKIIIYTAPVYNRRDGSIGIPEKVAQGYYATYPADNETILHMNKTILSQAGLYVCTCDLLVTAAATVVVLVSGPMFTTNHTGSDNETITFSCSVSFNASSDVSCELKIVDLPGFTVARRNESNVKNALISCDLEHTIIANASSDQCHRPTCNVTLSNKGDIIYSRLLNAKVECRAISSTTVFLSREETSENRAIGLSVGLTILTVVIAIVIVYFIISSRRRDNMLSHPTEQSPNCQEIPADQCDTKDIGGPIIANDSAAPRSNDGYLKDPIYTEIIR